MDNDWKTKVVVWRPVALKIIGAGISAIVIILGVAYYLLSRKRDFIRSSRCRSFTVAVR